MNRNIKNRPSADFLASSKEKRDKALARRDFLNEVGEYVSRHEDKRGKVAAIKRYLHMFNNHFVHDDLRGRLKRGKVGLRTYYLWLKKYQEGGLAGLINKHHGTGPRMSPEIREKIEMLVCKNHSARFRDYYDDLRLLLDKDERPSYEAVRIYAKRFRNEQFASLVLMNEGRRGLRDRNMEVVLGRADENLTEPNERWEIDTTVADLLTFRQVQNVVLVTSDGKRCKIIGVCDVFSRSVKFCLVEHENSLAVGQVVKNAAGAWGLPKELVIDNGRPFKNRRITNFLRGAGIALHTCIPGNPVEKPYVERSFRTLTEGLFRRLPGYTGNCVANRPNEIMVQYSMSELQGLIDRWTVNIYEETFHGSTGQRPRERRNLPGFVPKVADEGDLSILLMEPFDRKVRRGHVRVNNSRYFHKRLPEGEQVRILVDDADASRIVVYYHGKFLCIARNFSQEGRRPSEIRQAKKERNQELKVRMKAHKALLDKHKAVETGIIPLIDAAERRRPVELPQKAEIVSFPSLEGVPKDQSELDLGEDARAVAEHGLDEVPYFTSEKEKFVWYRRRQMAGYELSDEDLYFIEEFKSGGIYQLVGSHLEQEIQAMGD